MAFHKKSDSFKKILLVALGTAFAILMLAISYKAAITSREYRSKAAETEIIAKQWEFNGTTTEGWRSLSNIQQMSVASGALHLWTKSSLPKSIVVIGTNFTLPQGIKKVTMNIKADPITGSCPSYTQVAGVTPKPCITPTPYQFPLAIEVHYFKRVKNDKGNVSYQEYPDSIKTPLKIETVGDGQFHEYTVVLPDSLHALPIHRVEVRFSQALGFFADIDYIRFIRTKILPTATPTPTPTPPAGCFYQARCQTREQTNCPVELVCPSTSTAPATTPSANITKTGTVTQVNLEGTSKYTLVVSNTEKYSLTILADQPSARGGAPTVSWDTIKQYVGKTATVTGLLQPSSEKEGFAGVGIPTQSLPTIIVYTIR